MNSHQRRVARRFTQRNCCDRCGMKEAHYVTFNPMELEKRSWGEARGFYTCPDLYDPETGRRKDMSDSTIPSTDAIFGAMAGMLLSMDAAAQESDRSFAAQMLVSGDGDVEFRSFSEVA